MTDAGVKHKVVRKSFSIDRVLPGGNALSEAALRELFSRIKRDYEQCSISVQFYSDREIVSENIDDVFADPLIRSTLVHYLMITGRNRKFGRYDTRLDFSRSYLEETNLKAQGERDNVLSLEHDVQHILVSCHIFGSGLLIRLIYVIISMLLVAAFVISLGWMAASFSSWSASRFLVSGGIVIAIGILVCLWPTMFPRFVFDFGAGRRNWQNRQILRKFIFGSVVLEFLVGIAVNYFTGWLAK
jgi:hypothetical protein